MKPPRRARAAGAALLLALAGASCRSARPAASPAGAVEAAGARDRLEEACRAAWAPRRIKALFSAEVRPAVGAVSRGYLSVFWDGRALRWRTTLPVAGDVAAGVVERGSTSPGGLASMLSGRLVDSDALWVLLGAPECPAADPRVERAGEFLRVRLAPERAVLLRADGTVAGFELPGGVDASVDPGRDLPSRIEIRSRKGRAVLRLEQSAEWPESEPIPGTGG